MTTINAMAEWHKQTCHHGLELGPFIVSLQFAYQEIKGVPGSQLPNRLGAYTVYILRNRNSVRVHFFFFWTISIVGF